jgi:hypothetical protein
MRRGCDAGRDGRRRSEALQRRRVQIRALKPPREAAEDHVDHMMLVEHLAEAAELLLVG